MAEDQKDRFIQYLAEQYQEEQLTRKAVELVLEDFMERQKSLEERMCALQAQQQEQEARRQSQHEELRHELEDERKKRKSAERKVRDLEERLDCAYQELYGDRRQRVRKKTRSGEPEKLEPDREKEKGDLTVRTTRSVRARWTLTVPKNVRISRWGERDLSNRPDSYKRMGVVGDPVFHPSDLSRVLGRVIERETVRGYTEAGFTLGDRLLERQGLATREIVIRIRSRLDSELAKAPEFRSRYYREALNYLGKFGKELFAYLDDGELPIDNNLAERTIRKLTTQRNNLFHYGSDVGAEMVATYHSVISTVKLYGHSVWDFIGSFFKKSLAAGTMLTWFLARLVWPPSNVKIRTNYLKQFGLGHCKVS